jgi:murein DD-endopeptidase
MKRVRLTRNSVAQAILQTVSAIAILLACSSRVEAQVAADSLTGTWAGVLAGQLHLVVTIEKTSAGELTGFLNSVDQHATLTLANVKLNGGAVHFEVPRVGGVYDGKMSNDGDEISGSWTQTGAPAQPLDFKRGASASAMPSASANSPTAATKEHTPKPLTVGLDATVDVTPIAFKSAGKWHVAYELHLTSMDKWNYTLNEIDVVAAGSPDVALTTYSGNDLIGILTRPGLGKSEGAAAATLAPGGSAVAFLWVTADSLEQIPAALQAKIKVKIGDYPEAMTVVTPAVTIDKKPVVVIASPLDATNLVAANGPSNTSPHRRALIPIDGHAYISQRFAIDWVETYPDGKTYQGDSKDNKNYKIYGSEIHSVADGVVTEVKDGIPQNIPNAEKLAVPITLETIGGNHVIVDIGGGRFAFFAHMQPGSPRVKVGDHVKTGDVLGLVGNTGNSSEPHLHFDICDASSMLGCEGLPYAFASYELTGTAAGDGKGVNGATPVARTMEIPAEDDVVTLKLK